MELSTVFHYLEMAYKILLMIPVVISLLIVIFLRIPGPQPEQFLYQLLDLLQRFTHWVEKYSKKPRP